MPIKGACVESQERENVRSVESGREREEKGLLQGQQERWELSDEILLHVFIVSFL